MGHAVNPDKKYEQLQQYLDLTVTGAPASPTLMKILKLLFNEEEASYAVNLPLSPKSLGHISRKTGIEIERLDEVVTRMAEKGLVIDLDYKNRRFVMLAPIIIGFFEFTFMRHREDAPMKELAELFEQYMKNEGDLAHSVFQGQTQIGRSLVREEALTDYSEILDWERASKLIESANLLSVGLCACRHHHSHLGDACERPQRTCLSLNYGAAALIKSGIAEEIDTKEAMDILQQCKEAGLAQTGDNVQRNPTYICNCCGCCCGMMQGIRTFNLKNAIVSSNYIMEIDLDSCIGCGKCAKACPVEAIEIREKIGENGKKKRWAVRDEELCLGCGVCYNYCKKGSISMKSRASRVFTPETVFDKTIAMAIERGRLAPLIFDDPTKLSHRALGRIVSALENTSLYKATMAIEPLRSVFFNNMVKGAKAISGGVDKAVS